MGTILASVTDQWSDGKRLHVIGTLAFSGSYVTGGDTLDFGAAGVMCSQPPNYTNIVALPGYLQRFVPGTNSGNGKVQSYGGASDVAATGVLTSNNTNVSDGDTVTIRGIVYTFKTTITGGGAVAFNVKIGASADASLTSLGLAINGTGVVGTDVGAVTAANAFVKSSTVSAHALTMTALVSGSAGNAITTVKTAVTLSWGAATLTGGVDGTSTGAELAAAAYPTDLAASPSTFYAIFNQLS